MNLGRYSAYWARMHGERPALVFKGQSLSWAQFDAQADGVAAQLQAMGVGAGDRVGIMLGNCTQWAVGYAAILKAGAILVPLNPRYGRNELRLILAQIDCAAVVSQPELIANADERWANAADAGTVTIYPMRGGSPCSFADAAGSGVRAEPVVTAPDDTAIISFTSGSTGLPKGAMLTHQGLFAMACNQILTFGWSSEDRTLLLAPFAFTGGCVTVFTPAFVAGGCVYIEEVPDPGRALQLIMQEGITSICAVPILFERIAASPDFEQADLSKLRTGITGGAPVSEALLKRYLDRGTLIRQTYGCTEACGMIAAPSAAVAVSKPWSCGDALPSLEIRLVNEEGQDCAQGEAGEIWLRGVQLLKGYWGLPEADAQSWTDGWFRSGDMGQRDEQGQLRIVDRKKNMIISGGVNIYAAEVEREISLLPGVAEVLVFGQPDASWGERVVAVVHGRDLDGETLIDACRRELGGYKAPKEIIISTTPLPRTTSGKISRAQIDHYYQSLAALPRAVAGASARRAG